MRYFLSFIILSTFYLTALGQNQFIGVKGGYAWTDVSTNFISQQIQPGFCSGFTYDCVTKNKITFGAELLYEKRGFVNEIIFTDESGNSTNQPVPIHYNYNYFSLPLKVGYSIGNKFYGFGNMGICPALLQKATNVYSAFNIGSTYYGEFTVVLTNVSKFDLAGLAEIGCGYIISKRFSIVSSFRYQYSFTSVTNDNYLNNYYIRNYGMTLSLGIKYNLTYKTIPVSEPTEK